MDIKIKDSWKRVLRDEFAKKYFLELTSAVKRKYMTTTSYPPQSLIFNAFNLCPLEKITVVILGQDPYHNAEQAHGLAFSVPDGVPTPPSLVNIYKELTLDLQRPVAQLGNLEHWADQGVFLLNTTLTVRAHEPGSHHGLGWEQFTDTVIKTISEHKEHVVFLLWGAHAIKKAALIDGHRHLILTAPHPSPLSAYRGFFGCKHFSKTNSYLRQHQLAEIIW